jgi:hypothetical protein
LEVLFLAESAVTPGCPENKMKKMIIKPHPLPLSMKWRGVGER